MFNTGSKLLAKNVITLKSELSVFNILKKLPRQFAITTKNTSGKFNILLLAETSPVISRFHEENPNSTEYHLDIEDKENILAKLENIYQGSSISINQEDILVYEKIRTDLEIYSLPSFSNIPGNYRSTSQIKFVLNRKSVQIDLYTFLKYINNLNIDFTIRTKKREYICKYFGVIISPVISDYILSNPESTSYYYDIDDENEEFQYFADILNFKLVSLTSQNSEIIKEFAEDLGFNEINNIVDSYNESIDKISKTIDDQEEIINSIDEIFDLLYKIKEYTVDSVVKSIKDSKWSKTEKDIYELAAFLIQVVSSSIQLHTYLVDLLEKLNQKESNEKSNKLDLLLPVFSNMLIQIFNKELTNNNNNKSCVIPFVYQMYKRNLIPKDKIDIILKECSLINNFFIAWFLPELLELREADSSIQKIKSKIIITNSKPNNNFLKGPNTFTPNNFAPNNFGPNNFGPNNMMRDKSIQENQEDLSLFPKVKDIDEYKQIRDKGEINNEILQAIRNDDIDTFQSFMSKDLYNMLKVLNNPSMFEPFIENNIRYINYAAAYGSIKCFKYMLLNNEEVDESTLKMAIIGGNNELIRIVDNQDFDFTQNKVERRNFGFYGHTNFNRTYNPLINAIIQAIKMHKNDLFDWLFEQKIKLINVKRDMPELVLKSLENGNAHSLVQIVDNGYILNQQQQQQGRDYKQLVSVASYNNFYSLVSILRHLSNNTELTDINLNIESILSFDNIYIFKLLEEDMSEFNLFSTLFYSIRKNFRTIIEYFFNNIVNKKIKLFPGNSVELIKFAIINGSNELINYLFDKINELNIIDVFSFCALLKSLKFAINNSNFQQNNNIIMRLRGFNHSHSNDEIIDEHIKIEAFKRYAKLVYEKDPKSNFTEASILSFMYDSKDLISYFIDNKYIVNYVDLAESIIKIEFNKFYNDRRNFGYIEKSNYQIASFDLNTFSLVMDQIDTENKKILLDSIDKNEINKPIPVIEYLLKENASLNYSLIQSINQSNFQLFEQILDKNSDPSFINKIFEDKTALIAAVQQQNSQMVKKLLSIPGIDPSFYISDFKTPLVLSINNSSDMIFDLILDFYKDDIKSIKWQLETAVKIIIGNYDSIIISNVERSFNRDQDYNDNKNVKNKILHKIVKLNCIDPNFCTNKNSLLTYACANNELEIVKDLLKYDSIDPNLKCPNTPLFIALNAQIKNFEIAKLLVQHPKIDAKSVQDAFNTIIILGDDNADELLDSIVNHPSFVKDDSQILDLIQITINQSNVKLFTKLFEYSKLDINSPLFNGNSALIEAINSSSSEDLISCILNFPNFDSKKNDFDKIFDLGKSENVLNLIYNFDKEHDHLIDLTKDNGDGSILKKLYIKFFKDKNIFPNHRLQNGLYPLQYTIENGNDLLSLCLINSGEIEFNDIYNQKEKKDKFGINYLPFSSFSKPKSNSQMSKSSTTYLHVAAKYGRIEIIKELLSKHVYDINVKDSLNETPLFEACKNFKTDCVKFLFQYDDLDFSHKNKFGYDAIAIIRNMECTTIESYKEIKNKDEYLSELINLMSKVSPPTTAKINVMTLYDIGTKSGLSAVNSGSSEKPKFNYNPKESLNSNSKGFKPTGFKFVPSDGAGKGVATGFVTGTSTGYKFVPSAGIGKGVATGYKFVPSAGVGKGVTTGFGTGKSTGYKFVPSAGVGKGATTGFGTGASTRNTQFQPTSTRIGTKTSIPVSDVTQKPTGIGKGVDDGSDKGATTSDKEAAASSQNPAGSKKDSPVKLGSTAVTQDVEPAKKPTEKSFEKGTTTPDESTATQKPAGFGTGVSNKFDTSSAPQGAKFAQKPAGFGTGFGTGASGKFGTSSAPQGAELAQKPAGFGTGAFGKFVTSSAPQGAKFAQKPAGFGTGFGTGVSGKFGTSSAPQGAGFGKGFTVRTMNQDSETSQQPPKFTQTAQNKSSESEFGTKIASQPDQHSIENKFASKTTPKAKFTIHNESFFLKADPNFQQQKQEPNSMIQKEVNSENDADLAPSKPREFRAISHSKLDDDEFDFNPRFQPPSLSQEQLMALQQRQQQQWFQMIQMNNQYQAQMNMHMMNQARLNQSIKKKKKRSKK